MRLFLAICLLCVCTPDALAQLSQVQVQKLDSLFLEWNQPNHPGGSVGVMQNGQIIYSSAFGLASLEYLVPNNTNTIYNIASVSKQFTSMGILILEQQGKLSIDEDIRTYLPDLPDFGEKVTLRHCMHHTSGMRSLHALLGMAGWRGDDTRTNADLFRFMKKQKELNFKPGERYLYCNTGYMLMADIIEKISGETFPVWMKKNVFQPLGMIDTYVAERYNSVVPGNATSYLRSGDEGFSRAIDFWDYIGSGNMHATTRDLLNWMENYHRPTEDWAPLFERMKTTDLLNNGDRLDYAFGVGTSDYKGEKRISHGGSIGGFRSHVATFPQHQLNIVVLTNFSAGNAGGKTYKIADILLDKAEIPQPEREEDTKPVPLSLTTKQLQAYEGTYYSDELDTQYHFYVKDGELMGNHTRHGDFAIQIMKVDELEATLGIFRNIKIKRRTSGEVEGIYVSNGRVRNMWFVKR